MYTMHSKLNTSLIHVLLFIVNCTLSSASSASSSDAVNVTGESEGSIERNESPVDCQSIGAVWIGE